MRACPATVDLILIRPPLVPDRPRAAGGGRWSVWGRGALTGYEGREGDISLDGDVLTGLLGVDYEHERLLTGVAVSYSDGDGSFRLSGSAGNLDSTLVSVYPYLRFALTEQLSVWGLLGYGTGDIRLTTVSGAAAVDTDIDMKMGAFGVRGALLSTEMLDVALKSDAMLVRMDEDATVGLQSMGDADAGRVRLLLEGSHSRTLTGGGILTPALELGVRYDDGDAETGVGVELGGALRYSDPARGLTVEATARALLAHEESEYEEWGIGGFLQLDPGISGRGLSLRLDSSWGAVLSGTDSLWTRQDSAGLAADTHAVPASRVHMELGYGMDVPGSHGVLTPYSALEFSDAGNHTYRLGWQFKLGESLYLSLDGERRERFNVSPDHGLMLRATFPLD